MPHNEDVKKTLKVLDECQEKDAKKLDLNGLNLNSILFDWLN